MPQPEPVVLALLERAERLQPSLLARLLSGLRLLESLLVKVLSVPRWTCRPMVQATCRVSRWGSDFAISIRQRDCRQRFGFFGLLERVEVIRMAGVNRVLVTLSLLDPRVHHLQQ